VSKLYHQSLKIVLLYFLWLQMCVLFKGLGFNLDWCSGNKM
jgi:hypothetical protein